MRTTGGTHCPMRQSSVGMSDSAKKNRYLRINTSESILLNNRYQGIDYFLKESKNLGIDT